MKRRAGSLCGPACIFLTYIFIFFACGTYCICVTSPWSFWVRVANCCLFKVIAGLAVWSHIKCVRSDPGIVITETHPANTQDNQPKREHSTATPPVHVRPVVTPSADTEHSFLSRSFTAAYRLKQDVGTKRSETTGMLELSASARGCPESHLEFDRVGVSGGNTKLQPIDLATTYPSFPLTGHAHSMLVRSPELQYLQGGRYQSAAITVSSVDRGVSASKSTTRWCKDCALEKPFRAHHCSVCRRCVMKMDHHCPWVNNCIGMGNQKPFLLFLTYICITSCFAFTGLCVRLIPSFESEASFFELVAPTGLNIMNTTKRHQHDFLENRFTLSSFNTTETPNAFYDPEVLTDRAAQESLFAQFKPSARFRQLTPVEISCLLILFLEVVVFGVFSFVMLCDQLVAIGYDCTAVDKRQRRRRGHWALRTGLHSVCGSSCNWTWLLPI